MKLAERHMIKRFNSFWKELEEFSFLSKNIYNSALYILREAFFTKKAIPSGYDIIYLFTKEKNKDYLVLPAKVSQQSVLQATKDMDNFLKAIRTFKKNPSKFQGKIKPPKYKDSVKGRAKICFTKQAISKKELKNGYLLLSGTKIKIPTKLTYENICEVQVTPTSYGYLIAAIYNQQEPEIKLDNGRIASIDLGLNNLATLSYSTGDQPKLINGRPLKSINQYYNRELAEASSNLMKGDKRRRTSKKTRRLTLKRNNKVQDYLHKASRYIINQLVSKDITSLIIGYNQEWKQEINIGKKNNQNFVQIPHLRFVEMLEYKAKLVGIKVVRQEESYTSKCSFLDLEEIKKHDQYQGKRIKRGLFQASGGRLINADVNGSLNIMRKAIPNLFKDGIEAVVVRPVMVSFSSLARKSNDHKDKIYGLNDILSTINVTCKNIEVQCHL